ncbi:MAG: NAD(P)H-hydrate dehydratase, partial [Hyphomicrobiales bacterium]
DADALTSFATDTTALFQATHDSTILTPHEGEFARLFPDLAEKLSTPFSNHSRIDVVRAAAKRAKCHVLLKGPVTVVANPTGRVELAAALAERAAPWLATAGSGDVLAGLITGLLARGFAPFEAACSAAWLHVECARAFGPGLIAEDLPDMLTRVLSQWENDQTTGNTAL